MAKKFQKHGSKKCRRCGALNASTMDVCGSCKTPFDGTEDVVGPVTGSLASSLVAKLESEPIKRTLSSLLPKIEANWSEYSQSVHGGLGLMIRKSFIIGLKTENEEVTLAITEDGHAILGDDYLSKHVFDFEGPEEKLLAMLLYGKSIPGIPDSVSVTMGGRENHFGLGVVSPMSRRMAQDTAQQAAAKMLRSLLKE